jgi:hypothetical protein
MTNPYITLPLKFHDDNSGDINRFISTEIEVAGIQQHYLNDLRKVARKWNASIGYDGSVNSYIYDYEPFEIKTAPAKGKKFAEQIKDFCDVLKNGNAEINKSCGLHVHVDARDYEGNDLLKAVRVWSKVEGKLLTLVSESRLNNDYCKPYRDDLNIIDLKNLPENWMHLSKIIYDYGVDTDSLKEHDGGDRYRSLNFHSFFFRRTFENRMAESTLDANKIIKWGRLNAQIFDYAKFTPIEDIKKLRKGQLAKIMNFKPTHAI